MGLILSSDAKVSRLILACDHPSCDETVAFDLAQVKGVPTALSTAAALGWLERNEKTHPGRKLWLGPRHSGKRGKR